MTEAPRPWQANLLTYTRYLLATGYWTHMEVGVLLVMADAADAPTGANVMLSRAVLAVEANASESTVKRVWAKAVKTNMLRRDTHGGGRTGEPAHFAFEIGRLALWVETTAEPERKRREQERRSERQQDSYSGHVEAQVGGDADASAEPYSGHLEAQVDQSYSGHADSYSGHMGTVSEPYSGHENPYSGHRPPLLGSPSDPGPRDLEDLENYDLCSAPGAKAAPGTDTSTKVAPGNHIQQPVIASSSAGTDTDEERTNEDSPAPLVSAARPSSPWVSPVSKARLAFALAPDRPPEWGTPGLNDADALERLAWHLRVNGEDQPDDVISEALSDAHLRPDCDRGEPPGPCTRRRVLEQVMVHSGQWLDLSHDADRIAQQYPPGQARQRKGDRA